MILEVQITDPKTGSSRKMRFSHSPVRIGRNQLNDLSLDTPFVSEWHGTIRFDNRSVAYFDLGSTNGSMLDGKRLTKNVAVELSAASRLQVGGIELAVTVLQSDSGLGKTLGWGRPDDRTVAARPGPRGDPVTGPPALRVGAAVLSEPPPEREQPVAEVAAGRGPLPGAARRAALSRGGFSAHTPGSGYGVAASVSAPSAGGVIGCGILRPGRAPAPAAGGVRRVVRRPAQGLRAVRRRGRRAHDPRHVGAAPRAHQQRDPRLSAAAQPRSRGRVARADRDLRRSRHPPHRDDGGDHRRGTRRAAVARPARQRAGHRRRGCSRAARPRRSGRVTSSGSTSWSPTTTSCTPRSSATTSRAPTPA